MRLRHIMQGAGAAVLLLLKYLWPYLSPSHLVTYHQLDPVSPHIAGGLAIDLLVFTVVLAAVFALLDRLGTNTQDLLWVPLLALLAWKISWDARFMFASLVDTTRLWMRSRLLELAPFFVLALLLRFVSRRRFEQSVIWTRTGLALLGMCVLWMLPQMCLLALGSAKVPANAFAKPMLQVRTQGQGRIIWILLDELSYDQVFEHRQPGVLLPTLDRLRADSVVFTDVQPAGFYTEVILPSLLTGEPAAGIRSSTDGSSLSLRVPGILRWRALDPRNTIFGDAQQLGWSTGVTGWYNPYCRFLAAVLNSCYWTFTDDDLESAHSMSEDRSALENAAALPLGALVSRFHSREASVSSAAEMHWTDYERLMAAARSLIADRSIQMVFIHLPVPHPPGVYDRRTHSFSAAGTYLDNLVLADYTASELLQAIESTPELQQTTLLISSDHSWRIPLWRGRPSWTPEEERASSGRFDTRPLLLVHFPGEVTGHLERTPFAELRTRALLNAMLRGAVSSPAELDQWLQAPPRFAPPVDTSSGRPADDRSRTVATGPE